MVTEDFSILKTAFGISVTGTPGGGGDASVITAVVDMNFPNQEDHSRRGGRFAVATITVSADDWTPHYRDRFNFNGYDWEMSAEAWETSQVNNDSGLVYKGQVVRLIT